ncbi:MAG: hypothetical protein J1E01_12420, partial [Acetatifactor sp.]|nr:hypothetical protein [Acetatifactor sp.]
LVEVGSYVQRVNKFTRALSRLREYTHRTMPSLAKNYWQKITSRKITTGKHYDRKNNVQKM